MVKFLIANIIALLLITYIEPHFPDYPQTDGPDVIQTISVVMMLVGAPPAHKNY